MSSLNSNKIKHPQIMIITSTVIGGTEGDNYLSWKTRKIKSRVSYKTNITMTIIKCCRCREISATSSAFKGEDSFLATQCFSKKSKSLGGGILLPNHTANVTRSLIKY